MKNDKTKRLVLRRFMAFLKAFMPLKEAHVATLGGRGVEPAVWKKLGIEHGWLIERRRESSRNLIVEHRGYKLVNQLSSFPHILAGIGKDSVDSFHLDLDGTFTDKVISNFKPALELVLAGRGRCVAVTVADARWNNALNEQAEYARRAKLLFRDNADRNACRGVPRNFPHSLLRLTLQKVPKRKWGFSLTLQNSCMDTTFDAREWKGMCTSAVTPGVHSGCAPISSTSNLHLTVQIRRLLLYCGRKVHYTLSPSPE